MKRYLLLPFLLALAAVFAPRARAQEVRIAGHVFANDSDHVFYDLMIVNRRTRSGVFGKVDAARDLIRSEVAVDAAALGSLL